MSGEGGNSNDGLWMIFFVLVMLCVLFWGIWFLFKPQLLQTYLWTRQGQVTIGSLWTDDDAMFRTNSGEMSFGEAKTLLDEMTPAMLMNEEVDHWSFINATSLVTLKPLRIPFTIIFGLMIYYAVFRSPQSKHRKTYSLESLMKVQSSTFPVIQPMLNFNPLKKENRAPGSLVPAELPLFAEALSPEEWVAFHRIPIQDGKLNHDAIDNALRLQLCGPWKGYKSLPPYLQILLAAFALKAARKRQESDDLMGEISLCWNHKTGLKLPPALISKARKILNTKNISSGIIAECNRHAYLATALLGAIEHARSEGGVLAPAQFLWLRGHNRTLWYPLNNLGRNTFHAEALGAMSHHRAEKNVMRPIPRPMTKDAVDVIASYIEDNDKSLPIPQLDFSMIKNKKAPKKNQGIMKPAGT